MTHFFESERVPNSPISTVSFNSTMRSSSKLHKAYAFLRGNLVKCIVSVFFTHIHVCTYLKECTSLKNIVLLTQVVSNGLNFVCSTMSADFICIYGVGLSIIEALTWKRSLHSPTERRCVYYHALLVCFIPNKLIFSSEESLLILFTCLSSQPSF